MIEKIVIGVFSSILDFLLIHFFFADPQIKLNKKYKKNTILIISFILLSTGVLFIPSSFLPFWNLFLSIVVIWIIGMKNSYRKKELIFFSVLIIAIFLISEFTSQTILNLFSTIFSFKKKSFLYFVCGSSLAAITKTILLFTIKNKWFGKSDQKIEMNLSLIILLSSIPLASIFILCIILVLGDTSFSFTNTFCVIGVIFLTYMNIGVLFLYNKLSQHFHDLAKAQIESISLSSQLEQYAEIEKNQNELKLIRHDMKNNALALIGYLESNEIQSALKLLDSTLNRIEGSAIFYTKNPALNYLLNEKRNEARQLGIHISIDVLFPERNHHDSDIIVMIIGNLLDNSINATKRIHGTSIPKEIDASFKVFKNNLVIDISNTFDPLEVKTRSSRKVNGLGIKSIKKAVFSVNGLYEQWIEENYYHVSIVCFDIL